MLVLVLALVLVLTLVLVLVLVLAVVFALYSAFPCHRFSSLYRKRSHMRSFTGSLSRFLTSIIPSVSRCKTKS